MQRSYIIPALVLASTLLIVPGVVLAINFTDPVAPVSNLPATGLLASIQSILNVLLTIVGIIAVIYLIYGGIQYITSAGDQTRADNAKKTILYALIGIIVIGLSFVVVNFVLGALINQVR